MPETGNRIITKLSLATRSCPLSPVDKVHMLPFGTLRELYRIPLVRDNRDAIRFLNDLFYLLIALYRARRMQEFCWLQSVFFMMTDSFALYGRTEAKDTVDLLLAVPWFQVHRRNFYQSLASYRRAIQMMREIEREGPSFARQQEFNRHAREFVCQFKVLTNYNGVDEARVKNLLEQPVMMDKSIKKIREWLR